MKKILLTTAAIALLGAGLVAQNNKILKFDATPKSVPVSNSIKKNGVRCATLTPPKQWDEAFNKAVEEYKKSLPTGKASSTTYTIPVIFHIIYGTEAVGSGHNVSQAQVNSQIPILNADYGGTGYNTSQYASMTMSGHPAFYDYATANSLPAPDNNGVIIAGSGITFCLATKNPSGTTLAEPGIDRESWSTHGWADPSTESTGANLMSLFDNTIKPATIWDVTKYFNVWVSDGGGAGLLGYATFPPSSGLTGIPSVGTTSTDGVWMAYIALGNIGTAQAPYNKGRTLTHESGHWLGLRHIWGDGVCATDYCNDTPPAAANNFCPWPTAYPFHVGTCTGSPNNSPDGEMFMNFMDYSDDAAMWMFTTDQTTRFHTALANSPYRSGLTTSATNLCNVTVSTPTAAFTPPTGICAGVAKVFTDGSSGPPTGWNWSVLPITGVTITINTVANPSITFATAGTYTVTDAVSNSSGSNSISHTVSVTSCTTSVCDTATHIGNTDTLSLYTTATSTACVNKGYFMGTNCYAFTGLAESYAVTDFPTGSMQIKGAIILFYRNNATTGTHGVSTHTVTTLSMVNSTTNPGAAAVATKAITYANVAATTGVTGVDYAGTPGLGYASPIIIPYVAMFTTPVTLTTGFFMSLSMPPAGDTIALFCGAQKHNPTNTAWVDYSGTWSQFSALTGGSTFALAIFPIACPTSMGIQNNELGGNINLFPNPSNGNFNFAVTLPETTTLNFTVINTLGQSVFTKTEHNVSNTVITYDLSSLGKGVYFVSITDSKNNKTVKKIIIE
jgi:PKD repeat protein